MASWTLRNSVGDGGVVGGPVAAAEAPRAERMSGRGERRAGPVWASAMALGGAWPPVVGAPVAAEAAAVAAAPAGGGGGAWAGRDRAVGARKSEQVTLLGRGMRFAELARRILPAGGRAGVAAQDMALGVGPHRSKVRVGVVDGARLG